jgi:molybdenum cofactor cytidylyltransferase
MIGAIVLAAGSSRRFGGDKRKATLPNNKMVIQQSVETALRCFNAVTLVLRYEDNEFSAEISFLINNPNLSIFQAPDSALGMGHSLGSAIQEVNNGEGVFVFLADMPYLQQGTIHHLKETFTTNQTNNPIIAPTYQGQLGHPVGFAECYFDELAALTGDKGAKPVMHANAAKVIEVTVDDPGVLKDVDTPKDL